MNIPRDILRMRRLRTYRAYRSTTEQIDDILNTTSNNSCGFYEFNSNHPQVSCSYKHFQLRNCVQYSNDNHILYLAASNRIASFNPISRKSKRILSSDIEIVSFHSLHNYLVCGGLEGELQLSTINGNLLKDIIIADTNSTKITNHCELFDHNGSINIMTCNNDNKIRIVDPDQMEPRMLYELPKCVNKAAISPDFTLLAAALDDQLDYILDYNTGKTVFKCEGHRDFSFSVAWHPSNEYLLATGNQDQTVMI